MAPIKLLEHIKRSVVIVNNKSWLLVISVMILLIGCREEKKPSPSFQTDVKTIEFCNSTCWISRISVGQVKKVIIVECYDKKTDKSQFVRTWSKDDKIIYESINVKYFEIPYQRGVYLIKNKEITYYDTEISNSALLVSLQSLRDYALSGEELSAEELCRILNLKKGRLLKDEIGTIQ